MQPAADVTRSAQRKPDEKDSRFTRSIGKKGADDLVGLRGLRGRRKSRRGWTIQEAKGRGA